MKKEYLGTLVILTSFLYKEVEKALEVKGKAYDNGLQELHYDYEEIDLDFLDKILMIVLDYRNYKIVLLNQEMVTILDLDLIKFATGEPPLFGLFHIKRDIKGRERFRCVVEFHHTEGYRNILEKLENSIKGDVNEFKELVKILEAEYEKYENSSN